VGGGPGGRPVGGPCVPLGGHGAPWHRDHTVRRPWPFAHAVRQCLAGAVQRPEAVQWAGDLTRTRRLCHRTPAAARAEVDGRGPRPGPRKNPPLTRGDVAWGEAQACGRRPRAAEHGRARAGKRPDKLGRTRPHHEQNTNAAANLKGLSQSHSRDRCRRLI
jgi:hypothetical protein